MNQFAALSEQLLRFSPDALVVVDSAGLIQFANETTRTLLGYAPERLIGQSIDLLVPDRLRPRHSAHIGLYLKNPANREMGARVTDLVARRADGTEFPAGVRLAPFQIGSGHYVAAAVRDMTYQRAITDALVAARTEADRANRAKSRFLATASHDLRQPMHAIRLLNGSMQKVAAPIPSLQELLRRQELAIDHATRLLDSLLDVSRLESGAVSPQLGEVNLGSVFADLRHEFDSSAQSKGLHLEFSDTQSVVSTDRMLFIQLLQNLIGNALKYTERGYVRVAQTFDSECLIVKVEDSGIGIPADKLDRIFDEYYQVDPHGAPRLGVGLGLAIVREVSRLLGFGVTVTSKIGEGTAVSVRIPRQKLLQEAPPPRVDRRTAAPAALRSGNLILLEDNQSVRVATELFLNLEGYRTRSAATVKEAERLFGAIEPGDILVADYRLDGQMSGLDVLNRMRAALGWNIPAVILSGDLESVFRVVTEPIPQCRFLSKPVDTRALTEAIAALASQAFAARTPG